MKVRILALLLLALFASTRAQYRSAPAPSQGRSPYGQSPGQPPSPGRSPGQPPSPGRSPYGAPPGQPPSGQSPYGQPSAPPGQPPGRSPYGQPSAPPGQSRYGQPSPSPNSQSRYGQAAGAPGQYGQAQNQYRQGGPPQAPSPSWANQAQMPPENVEAEMNMVRDEVMEIEKEVHEVANMVNKVEQEIGAARQEALVGHKQAEELAEILAESAAADELNKSNLVSVPSILALILTVLLYTFNRNYAR